jgi:hypothetical protein
MQTNLMHYLFSVYFVKRPLRASGTSVAHHQEVYCVYVYIYIYIEQLVRVSRFGTEPVPSQPGQQTVN